MGKYSDFPSQTPYVRLKTAIYNPKRDEEYPHHFYMGVPQGHSLNTHKNRKP